MLMVLGTATGLNDRAATLTLAVTARGTTNSRSSQPCATNALREVDQATIGFGGRDGRRDGSAAAEAPRAAVQRIPR
jgi:hypothetical protein